MTGAQLRMARAAADLSRVDLAALSGVSPATIKRLEAGDGLAAGNARTVDALRRALEAAGATFLPENDAGPGVRWRRAPGKAEG